MGIRILKGKKWASLNYEDSLSNITAKYSFLNDGLKRKRRDLIDLFLKNDATDKFFTKGRIAGQILWKRKRSSRG